MTLVTGRWTYRGCRNDPTLIGDSQEKAYDNIFAETVSALTGTSGVVTGVFDMGPSHIRGVEGTDAPIDKATVVVALRGFGHEATPTEGWRYHCHTNDGYTWPSGERQVPTFLGTVVPAVQHGAAPAGYVAPFIAIRQP